MTNYLTHVASFIRTCRYFDASFLPASTAMVIVWLTLLGARIASAFNYVQGVSVYHRRRCLPDPTDHPTVADLTSALRKRARKMGKKKRMIIDYGTFVKLVTHWAVEARHARNRGRVKEAEDLGEAIAIATFAYLGLFRISNLVPRTRSDPRKVLPTLRHDDCTFNERTGVLTVRRRLAKTSGTSRQHASLYFSEHPLGQPCVVRAWRDVIARTAEKGIEGRPRSGRLPLFGGHTYATFSTRLRHGLKAVLGWMEMLPTTHSLRKGGAILAYQAGVPVEIIMYLGDWRSLVWMHYVDLPAHAEAVAQAVRRAVVNGAKQYNQVMDEMALSDE